jgi:hypothetical protein
VYYNKQPTTLLQRPCRLAHPQYGSTTTQLHFARRPVHSIISNFTTSSLHRRMPVHRTADSTIALHRIACSPLRHHHARPATLRSQCDADNTIILLLSSSALPSPTAQPVVSPLRVCLAESRQFPASSNALVALQKAAECCHYTQ